MDFIRENWLILASTLGIGGALAVIGRYIWTRFTGWVERNDLESQKLRLEKIKELIQLRNDFSEASKSEEVLVHTILKTATTIEIIKLSRQLNKNNSGFRYYLKQIFWFSLGIFGLSIFSGLIVYFNSKNIYAASIFFFILATLVGLGVFSIIGTERSKKKLSTQFIASAILQAKNREDVDIIITKALQGETFVEPVDGFKGFFLGEMRPINYPQSEPASATQESSSSPHTQTTTPPEN